MNRTQKILLFLCIILVGIILATLFFTGNKKDKSQKIGFIMTGSKDEEGWNRMHYEGVASACEHLGVQLLVKENVKEFSGECGPAIEDLIDQGANMIILSSYGYPEEIKDLIEKYKDVEFYLNTFDFHADNTTSYFSRLYQARYLAGIVAGMQTKNGNVGYVAAMPNSEVNRGISAFTLGVRRVNQDATVTVAWTGSWDNEKKERDRTDALINDVGVDVITYHQNQAYVIDEADMAGIYSIGYHQKVTGYSNRYLTAAVCDWKTTYEAIIRQYLQGKSSASDIYWIGIEENAVGLADYSSAVSGEMKEEITKAENEILSGKDVFSGKILDNEGVVRCNGNETISDEVLLEHFDWYVEGVEFYEDE